MTQPEAEGTRILAESEPRSGPGILQNSMINVAGLVATTGVGALIGFLTARTLGRQAVGILAVAFGISEFGRAISACTHIPSIVEYHGERHDEGTIFGSSLAVKVTVSFAFVALVALASPWIHAAFDVPLLVVVLASLVVLIVTGFEVGAARMEASNRMATSNLINASGAAVALGLVTALVLSGRLSIYTSLAATLTFNLVLSSLAWRFARPRGVPIRVDPKLAVSMVHMGLRIVSASLLTQGLLWSDTLLISHLRGNAEAGVYQTVFTLTNVMVAASTSMGVALVPALSRLRGLGQDTSRGYQRGTIIALGLSVAIAATWILTGRFLLGLIGPAFVEGYPALVILTLFGISAALAVPAATMLTIHGRAGLLTTLSLAQLLINIPLNVFLITRFGLVGAASATTAVFALGTAMSWMAVKRTTGAMPLSRAAIVEVRAFALDKLSRRARDAER